VVYAKLAPPVQKHTRANRKHIDSITLVDIALYFHLPIRNASKTLKIGVSVLKRKCRQYGIPRWPHRKIKSLDSLIHDLEVKLMVFMFHLTCELSKEWPSQFRWCLVHEM
jgi:hypothetical protein